MFGELLDDNLESNCREVVQICAHGYTQFLVWGLCKSEHGREGSENRVAANPLDAYIGYPRRFPIRGKCTGGMRMQAAMSKMQGIRKVRRPPRVVSKLPGGCREPRLLLVG
jgi:hypothetical protein